MTRLAHVLGVSFLLLAPSAATADDLREWLYAKTLTLDTTASGAGVSGDVAHYPLAVPLSAGRFDFSQAQADGADIRFSRAESGALLPHSIELWDPEAGRALVWVKLDLVKGKRPHVKHGFVGVWHLDDEGSVEDGGYCDATATAAHATGVNLAPGARVDGRLGKALRLEHARGQWVKLDTPKKRSFDLTTRATFSIWARARAISTGVWGGSSPGTRP